MSVRVIDQGRNNRRIVIKGLNIASAGFPHVRHVRQIQVQDDEIPGACANVIDCMAGRGCFDNVGRQSVLNEEVP